MSPISAIAHYRIAGKLGEGGMGAVYRATDTKLGRDVAIKVLPDSFAQDPDRMARFAREAQVLASLNHPNIAVIHGVEERALIMELVDGPTLAERIGQGPIPIDEALPMARQIAEALEYAHERGVVHRDLKPANIKMTPEGRVKVLDFGLAKALGLDAASSGNMANSPTLTMRATLAGVIMGTAGYMSPEQAKGKPVDRRADIWAFGVVLVEMLTGRVLYEGETVSETLASVIKDQPDLAGLPDSTPPVIRRLLKRCLDKDPQRRLQAMGEARIVLDGSMVEETPALAAAAASRPGLPRWASGVMAALAASVCLLAFLLWRGAPVAQRPLQRFSMDLGADAVRGRHITAAISPDGSRIVFAVRRPTGGVLLATRSFDQAKPSVLPDTAGAQQPFFSPDSQWIGFFTETQLKKISVQGGAAIRLADVNGLPRGAWWGDDGNIVATLDTNHLFRIPAGGGRPEMMPAKPEDHGERTWRWPQVLPGGEFVVFTGNGSEPLGTGYENANVEVLSLKTRQVKTVQRGGYFGRYLPSGHLTYLHQGTLFAAPFDLKSLETRGAPVPVLDEVAAAPGQGGGQLDFSQTGAFVYSSGQTTGNAAWAMAWINGSGGNTPVWPTGLGPSTPKISPDGKFIAAILGGDLNVHDLSRAASVKLTFSGAENEYPVWSPDGKHIAYAGTINREHAIWWIRADGSSQPQKLYACAHKLVCGPTSFSPDGRLLVLFDVPSGTHSHIKTLALDLTDPDRPKPGSPEVFLDDAGGQSDGVLSPDGRWIAYTEFQGAVVEIFVRPFPGGPSTGKWLISSDGRFPNWSRTAKELFYLGNDNRIMVSGYDARGSSFTADKPRQWSTVTLVRTGSLWNYDLAPDGKRVIGFPSIAPETDEHGNVHVTVLLNFFDELKRRVK